MTPSEIAARIRAIVDEELTPDGGAAERFLKVAAEVEALAVPPDAVAETLTPRWPHKYLRDDFGGLAHDR